MRFTIGRKISAGFGSLIVLTIAIFSLTFLTVRDSIEINDEIRGVRSPSVQALDELNLLVNQSKGLFYYVVYFPSINEANEKQQLREIHAVKIPEVEARIEKLSKNWSNTERAEVEKIFQEIAMLITYQEEVMMMLPTMDSYRQPEVIFVINETMEEGGDVYEQTNLIVKDLDHLINSHRKHSNSSNDKMVRSFERLSKVVTFSGVLLLIGGIAIAFFTVRMIVTPVNYLKELLLKMSLGILPESQPIHRNDEIGEMAEALEKLMSSIHSQTDFSNAVGSGQFDAKYTPLSDDDTLGYALLKMRDELNDLTSGLEEKVRERTAEVLEKQQEIEEKNEKLEKLYDDVTDSIRYAKRLQDTILPPDNYVFDKLKDPFILFKPKDIVSGDFYWMEETKDSILIAACDCTGHGVPGAFMSLVSSNLLNKAVNEKGCVAPNDILNEVSKGVSNKSQETTKSKDGMDLSILRVYKDGKKIEWAGANNPLYYVRNGEVEQIKADKYAVEVFQGNEKPYVNHTFEIQEGDVYYIFTDGYADQFGGPNARKFMYKRFREFLGEIHAKPMMEQKKILDRTIEDWRGEHKQIDDILVIGLKF